MAGHTPGPWALRRGHSVVEIRTVAGLAVAQTTSDAYWQSFSAEADANARLIAAAPEMLEALKQAREYLRYSLGSTSETNPYPAIDAAIAKAEGRE